MGRSRGGLTTKIHALVDANGNPIALKLTEGQAHDGRSASDLLDRLGAGQILLADRAYDSDALRQSLAQRGAWANVKPMPGRVNIPAFSAFLYRYRNLRRKVLQQAQAFPRRRYALRKTRRQLPRHRQTRRRQNLDAIYESVT
jgi:transposase